MHARMHSPPSLPSHLHLHPPSHWIPPALAVCPIVSPRSPPSLPLIVSYLASLSPRRPGTSAAATLCILPPHYAQTAKRPKTGAQAEMVDSASACVCICTPALMNQTKMRVRASGADEGDDVPRFCINTTQFAASSPPNPRARSMPFTGDVGSAECPAQMHAHTETYASACDAGVRS